MASSVSKRIFGADLNEDIKKVLQQRQKLWCEKKDELQHIRRNKPKTTVQNRSNQNKI